MATKFTVVKNNTLENLRLRKWNKYYCLETECEVFYPSEEQEKTIKPGKFISFNVSKLDDIWLQRQRLSIDFEYRVYTGRNSVHSGTLQVGELVNNKGIVLYVAADTVLHKRFISITEQSGAANTGCLLRFLHLLCTEKHLIKGMEEMINTIMADDSSSAASLSGGHTDSVDNPTIAAG